MATYKDNAVAWVNKDKNGKPYISFKASRDIKEGESLRLFKNDKKDKDGNVVESRPDYKSYEVIEDEAKPESETVKAQDISDDIPF